MPEIVIPWRPGCPYRKRALEWVIGRYRAEHPEWRVTVAKAPAGPWIKALAVVPAVAACPEGSIVIVADADVWTDGLLSAVAAVEAGVAWSIPHDLVYRLTDETTTAVIDGADWKDRPLAQDPYTGLPGGGFVAARREVILSTPPDCRFVGWG